MKSAFAITLLIVALPFCASAGPVRDMDGWNLSLRPAGDEVEATTALAARRSEAVARFGASDLRPERVSESLAGRHVLLREYLDGHPVLNGGFTATFDLDGTITSYHDRRARSRDATVRTSAREARESVVALGAPEIVADPSLVGWLHEDGVARLAWRIVWRSGYDEFATLVDASDGSIILTAPLFFSVDGRIFDPNPVTALNQPALRDNDDSSEGVPDSAYTIVTVEGLDSDEALTGKHVSVTELETPVTARAKPLSGLLFDRSQSEFEEVMVYVHIDRSQRYIQSLGFTGSKAIVAYSIPVDAHGVGGADNSYYRFSTPGRGRLVFGDGGVDDAEDADIVLHEYGHAIQDSIVPAGFTGAAVSEARALGEAFGDYWAFSSSYAANVASGADPFCVGNWDALCGEGPSSKCGYPAGATCLRRVDGVKTMADYLRSGGQGTEHRNGEIWSSALREIFVDAVALSGIAEGRRLADRTILESHFGMPPNPSFRTASIRLLDADRRLNSGRLSPSICRSMKLRGILDDEDCSVGLGGDVTMIQSPTHGSVIPDNQPAGVSSSLTINDARAIEALFVAVDVRHPRRGDLRLTLTGPDGTAVVVQTESSDSAADIVATYGLDTQPSQPLSSFLGKAAAGIWTLNVADNRGADEGELRTWSLLIRFSGDEPITDRGRPGSERLHVAVTGSTPGAAGTRFVSDVQIHNPGASDASATLFYTPSGLDGLVSFEALSVTVSPGQVFAFDDIVGHTFRTSGTGSIEIRGDSGLLVTSRVYNDQPEGSFGQFIRAEPTSAGVTVNDSPLHVVQLSNGVEARSNLGVTEVDGGTGEVEIRLFDHDGSLLSVTLHTALAYGHMQLPLFGGIGGASVDAARAEVSVTSGDARIIAYGSVVDNLSGDAVFVPGVRLPRPTTALVVPAVIHAEGAVGTNWRSDLWLLNAAESAVTVSLAYHPSTGGAATTVPLDLSAGELRRLDDVVSGTFAVAGTGSIEVSGDGLSSLIVTSRAWNDAPTGSFGQFIAARGLEESAGAGETLRLTHLDSDDTFRTNIGLTEVAGETVSARLVLLDASGAETASTTINLGPRENRQLNVAQLGAALRNGQAHVEILSGSGRILAYASVVDNRTGDAIYVPGR
jgi:subtilisin-like proprotein convertase family protein